MTIVDTYKGYIKLYNGHREQGNIPDAVKIGNKLVLLAEDELRKPDLTDAYKEFYRDTSAKIREFLLDVSRGAYSGRQAVASNGADNALADKDWFADEIPSETLADLIGLQELRDQLLVNVLAPLSPKYSSIYQKYRKDVGMNLLLWGPPGTGKTHTARCIAGTLRCKLCVVRIKDVLCSLVGEGARAIDTIFEQATHHDRCVIVFDEVDSIGSARGSDQARNSQEQLLSLLTRLDGFSSKTKPGQVRIVIAATNVVPTALDSALTRGGRFTPYYVGLPDEDARCRFVSRAWGKEGSSGPNIPLAPDVTPEWVGSRLEGYAGADIKAICSSIANLPLTREIKHFAATGEEISDRITREDCETIISRYINPISDDLMLQYDAYRANMEYGRYLRWYEPHAREARKKGDKLPLYVVRWLDSLDAAGKQSPRFGGLSPLMDSLDQVFSKGNLPCDAPEVATESVGGV
jgi:AAA+ superfamily predicted ATPase